MGFKWSLVQIQSPRPIIKVTISYLCFYFCNCETKAPDDSSVYPLDVIPTYLLRAVAVEDVEEAEFLGCLELVEEDLGLCSYVCPSKIDHGENLRRTLTIIEKEG